MKFAEHGSHTIAIEDNLIVSKLAGAVNLESVAAYIKEVDDARAQLSDEDYFLLLDLKNVEGATPDAWKIAEEHNVLLASDKRLKAKAIVFGNTNVHKYAKGINTSLSSSKLNLFSDTESARTWLKKQGCESI